MSCLRNAAIIAGLGVAALIGARIFTTATTTPEQRAQSRYEADALSFCAAGGARLMTIAPDLEVRALITHAEPERGATYACAAARGGESMVLYVRAQCGVVLECAVPLALADARGEFVWVGDGVDLASLPGVQARPERVTASTPSTPARPAAPPRATEARPLTRDDVAIRFDRPFVSPQTVPTLSITVSNAASVRIDAFGVCRFINEDGAAEARFAAFRVPPAGSTVTTAELAPLGGRFYAPASAECRVTEVRASEQSTGR